MKRYRHKQRWRWRSYKNLIPIIIMLNIIGILQVFATEPTQISTLDNSTSDNSTLTNTESISTGKFNVVNTVKNGTIKLYEKDTLVIPNYLMPQQDYDIKIQVFDNMGIGNIEILEVKMWQDITGNLVRESSFNDVKEMDGKTKASILWTKQDGSLKLDAGEDITWELQLDKCKIPTIEELNDTAITEFEFSFRLKIGKVARMTKEDSKWQLAYKTNLEYGYYSIESVNGFAMEWYCEVQAPSEIKWGNLLPGIGYESESSKQRAGVVRYISNGKFNELVKFDGTWKRSEDDKVATLTEDPINPNEFALKVSKGDLLDSAKQIPRDGKFIYTAEGSSETDYIGNVIEDYYFYIKLNKEFDIGMYTGKITFGVSN